MFIRLETIQKMAQGKVHIVLHGTNEFPPDIMAKCIERGVTRVNANKLVLSDYNEYIAANTGKVPLTELMDRGTRTLQAQLELWMDHIGSTAKA